MRGENTKPMYITMTSSGVCNSLCVFEWRSFCVRELKLDTLIPLWFLYLESNEIVHGLNMAYIWQFTFHVLWDYVNFPLKFFSYFLQYVYGFNYSSLFYHQKEKDNLLDSDKRMKTLSNVYTLPVSIPFGQIEKFLLTSDDFLVSSSD